MNAYQYEQAVKRAERVCTEKRKQATARAEEFMRNLHGTHMAPGKFKR